MDQSRLTIVSIPIGNTDDISLRAVNTLREADCIIGEDRKIASKLLRHLDIKGKDLELLNEHSTQKDVEELFRELKNKNVALISDAGTPAFCDPGFQLTLLYRKAKLKVTSVPGASSLMTLLSLSSKRLNTFQFKGFPPASKPERQSWWGKLKSEKDNLVVMDTPYRLRKTIGEIQKTFSERMVLIGLDLTQENELVIECKGNDLLKKVDRKKAEFIALIYSKAEDTKYGEKGKR